MNIELKNVINAVKKGDYRITDHVDEEAQDDKIKYDEILNSVINGKIIEQYSEDQPCPRCLVPGHTFADDPIPSVCSL